MYTFLEFLGDVGGLNGSLQSLIQPILSLIVPSLLSRSILNENFKFDDNGKKRNDAISERLRGRESRRPLL